MSSPQLIRWSGLSLMLGGIGLAVHYITHPPGETAQYSLQPLWGFSHWLGAFAWLLILFGNLTPSRTGAIVLTVRASPAQAGSA